ncbi:helix-turn-helix domain-containing protein [Streptomyces triticirhizae]|uniref:GntR family transcriptional regulator n=1 Tax=Streptomyces triticirhizae TaxID=2483353 RepID=A0A3M2M1P1_9ACTN|nr:GntR family transcriptional regulator [Streptomyces triticirhizae]RMI43541.1 GntR family transcriptional regulator [Streptomyces triticirhizae]
MTESARRIADELRDRVTSGELAPGDRFPASGSLVETAPQHTVPVPVRRSFVLVADAPAVPAERQRPELCGLAAPADDERHRQ